MIPTEDDKVGQGCKRLQVGDVVLGGTSVGTVGEIPNAHAEEVHLKSKEHVEMGPAFSTGVNGPKEH